MRVTVANNNRPGFLTRRGTGGGWVANGVEPPTEELCTDREGFLATMCTVCTFLWQEEKKMLKAQSGVMTSVPGLPAEPCEAPCCLLPLAERTKPRLPILRRTLRGVKGRERTSWKLSSHSRCSFSLGQVKTNLRSGVTMVRPAFQRFPRMPLGRSSDTPYPCSLLPRKTWPCSKAS